MTRPVMLLLLAPLLVVGLLLMDVRSVLYALAGLVIVTQLPALWRACDVFPTLPLTIVFGIFILMSFPW